MSKKIPPMPAPFTDVPNGMPVGVWKPGMYHSTAYIEWQRKYGTLFNTPKAGDIEVPLTTPDEWNLSFGKRAEQRQCVSCDGWFTPVGKQITCSEPCREQRRREVANRNYKPRPLADRTCVVCEAVYSPTKVTAKTCGDPECRREHRRRWVAERREQVAS